MLETYGIPQPSIADRKIISRFGYAGIYFVGWEGDPDDAPIKVGIADNPFERFGNFQCGNWRKLQVHEDAVAMASEVPATVLSAAAGRNSVKPSTMNVAVTPATVAAYMHIDPGRAG